MVAFRYGLLVERGWTPEDHTRRLSSIRRLPNQKAISGGHNRRPQQKAITEGHTNPLGAGTPPEQAPPWEQAPPQEQAPPWTDPPELPPWVWAWKPARHAGIPTPLETCCKACWETTCNACWDSTPYEQTHTCKNITFATSLRTVKIVFLYTSYIQFCFLLAITFTEIN